MSRKTVLITGCSSGFGKLAARTFHDNDWNVIATMRSPEKETDLIGHEHVLVTRLDVTCKTSVGAAIEEAIDRFGQIDVLVNNAGYGGHALFEQSDESSIRDMFETNVYGPVNTMRAILPLMRKQGGGTVINVTSMAALLPVPGNSVYTATKHAIGGLSEALALEYEPLGIRIRIVEPGAYPTTRFLENVDTTIAETDDDLAAYEQELRAHFAATVEQVATQGGSIADPQEVADRILQCATQDTPVHNPVGADAQMLVTMMTEAPSRQAFLDQFAPMVVPRRAV